MLPISDSIDHASLGNHYDWLSLKIELTQTLEPDYFLKLRNKKTLSLTGEPDALRVFIHEYIHFLQNIATNWGGPILTDSLLALMKIGASSVTDKRFLQLPVKFESISKEIGGLFQTGYEEYEGQKKKLTHNEGTTVFLSPNTFPDYKYSVEPGVNSIYISNGRIKKCVGLKTIRENMAHIGSLAAMGFDDESIHDKIIMEKGFCSAEKLLDKQPEYWVLFEYFFNSPKPFTNIAKGIYALCAESLAKQKPEACVKRFFVWMDTLKEEPADLDLVGLVKRFSLQNTEEVEFRVSSSVTQKHIDRLIDMCEKHASDHHVYAFAGNLFKSLKEIRTDLDGGRRLYSFNNLNVNLNEKFVWLKYLGEIGSPVIKFRNQPPVIFNDSLFKQEDIKLLMGMTSIMELIQGRPEFACPFLEQFPICQLESRCGDCRTSPFLVKSKIKDGPECLFQNSLLLLGFGDRIS